MVSVEGRASLKIVLQLKNLGSGASQVDWLSTIEELPAVPVSWQTMPVATLLDVPVRLVPDCWRVNV
jgi:hypothetical protein